MFFLFFMPSSSMACECVAFTEEQATISDPNLLSEAKIAAKVRVLDVEMPSWGARSDDRNLTAKIEIVELYQGSTKKMDVLEVKSLLNDNCGRVLRKNEILDLLIFEEEKALYLRNNCTDLSQKGWKKIKSKSKDVRYSDVLSYEAYYDLAAKLDQKKHTVNLFQFSEMMKQDNTVILDLRPRAAYDAGHIEGAVHIGADITKENLENAIPSKDTTILTYCYNSLILTRMVALTDVTLPQIYAHGYKNLYKLSPVWQEDMKYENIDELSKIIPFTSTHE